jgi:hypothetical protein
MHHEGVFDDGCDDDPQKSFLCGLPGCSRPKKAVPPFLLKCTLSLISGGGSATGKTGLSLSRTPQARCAHSSWAHGPSSRLRVNPQESNEIMRTRTFRVTLPSRDIESFVAECETVDWYAYDSGERVMTDEGPDGEAVLLVETAPRPLPEESPAREIAIQ